MNKGIRLALTAAAGLLLRESLARLREVDLHEQVAIVTGGSRGLGLAIARELAAHGVRLALFARDAGELERAQRQLENGGATVFCVPVDLTVESDVHNAVRATAEHYGHVDILVNNAGVISVGPVQNMAAEDFHLALNVDFYGTLYPTLAVLPGMRGRGEGRIVNVTSIGGKAAIPHLLPYSCAKFAQIALSEGLRAELSRDGITVTTIVPGLLRTGSFLHALFKGRQAAEYGWFSVGDNVPGQSMSAGRAARLVVRALRRGEAERTLGLPAVVAARFAGLFPGWTADVAALVNRALPAPVPGIGVLATGEQVRARHGQPGAALVDTVGLSAARALNE